MTDTVPIPYIVDPETGTRNYVCPHCHKYYPAKDGANDD